MIVTTSLDSVATVDVLKAKNNDLNLAKLDMNILHDYYIVVSF